MHHLLGSVRAQTASPSVWALLHARNDRKLVDVFSATSLPAEHIEFHGRTVSLQGQRTTGCHYLAVLCQLIRLEGLSQRAHNATFENGGNSMQGDSRRRAGFAMFRTKTVESLDRTVLISATNDGPTEPSTSRWAPPTSDAFENPRVPTRRRLFDIAALSRGRNGTNTSLIAWTPGRFIPTPRTLLVDSAPFDAKSVDAGTQKRRIAQCEHHANNHIRVRREYARHAFADRHPHGHA
jgi:hypothetical protein